MERGSIVSRIRESVGFSILKSYTTRGENDNTIQRPSSKLSGESLTTSLMDENYAVLNVLSDDRVQLSHESNVDEDSFGSHCDT